METSWNSDILKVEYSVFGWIAFVAWSTSFYPQLFMNFSRKRYSIFSLISLFYLLSWKQDCSLVKLQCGWFELQLSATQQLQTNLISHLQRLFVLQFYGSVSIPQKVWLWSGIHFEIESTAIGVLTHLSCLFWGFITFFSSIFVLFCNFINSRIDSFKFVNY